MAYNPDVRAQQQLVEYQKFVQIQGDSRFPPISTISWEYADTTTAAVSTLNVYPKTAVITYLANASDINLSLSASNIDIGNVGIVDHYTTGTDTYQQIFRTGTYVVSGIAYELGALSVKTYGVSPVSGSVTVLNPTSAVLVTNTVGISTSQTLPISGSVTVLNPTSAVLVTNTVSISTSQTLPISGTVTVLNPVSTVQVTGTVATSFNPTQVDAFNRLRVSNPLTLFDSSHRFKDNNLWSTLTAVGGSAVFSQTEGLVNLNVTGASGSNVVRETTKVFSYQPGKSLLVMSTFVMAPSATNLRQRVGYFGQDNGIYVQLNDDVISFVERSLVTGTETVVPVSGWNGDKLNGTGPSGLTLDITKAQIMWSDIEWLGVGTVRVGFVINGQFITCHSFHHANLVSSTYITTASLPLRYEIYNKAATSGSKTLKQICSTVISEGGYQLAGLQQAVNIPLSAAVGFATQYVYYPIISIRLKTSPDRLDAIVILTALSIIGKGTAYYNWQVIASGVTGGGTWQSAGVDSAVEYNINGTSFSLSGGRILASGFLNASNQGTSSVDILKEALFKFQLERNGLTSTPYELTLIAATDTTAQAGLLASMDWEEVSR